MPSSVAPSLARFPASPRDALTIARIVKVNHAGEYGAIRIYSAQIRIASRLHPDLVAALSTSTISSCFWVTGTPSSTG